MSNVDEVLQSTESLSPDERVSLIARLWKTLPQECWPQPTADELIEAGRLLAQQGIPRNEFVPWTVVEQILADSVRSSRPKVYSAPRRFDMTTILVVMAGYACLFSGLKLIVADFDQVTMATLTIALFVTFVGIGQAFLFGGRKPRTASIIVGAVLTCLIIGVSMLWLNARGGMPRSALWFMLPYGVVTGIVYGYLAGVLVGGVFLVADKLRACIPKRRAAEPDDLPASTG